MTGPDEPPARPAPAAYVPPPPYARPPDGGAPWPGPPGYVALPYRPVEPPAPRPDPPALAFGVVGPAVAGFGTLLVLLAQLALPWYSLDGGLRTTDVRGRLNDLGSLADEVSIAYFSWLGWLLLVLALGSALAAAVPRPRLSVTFRIAGPIAAGFAGLFTVAAAQLVDTDYGDDTFYLAHLSGGFWFTLLGYICIGAAAVVGPRRRPVPARRLDRPETGATFGK